MDKCVERMQNYLGTLRRSLGWTEAELGERLGTTRQVISALENKHRGMRKIHYLAICKVVEDEIRDEIEWSGDEHELYLTQILLECFIKDDEGWFDSEEEYNNVKNLIDMFDMHSAALFTEKKTRDEVHKEFKQAMKDIGCGNLI